MASWKKRKNGSRLQNNFRKSPCFAEWKLQWGRGRMAPENTSETSRGHKERLRLQWGRGRMAPENQGVAAFTAAGEGRFNGAGAGWPRKTGNRQAAIRAANELHWGRGRMAPENTTCPGSLLWTA